MRESGPAAQLASRILIGFALLLLSCADVAQAAPRAEIPYRYRIVRGAAQVGPIDPQGNLLVMQDSVAVHLLDLITHNIVRSLDLIPTVDNDDILGYECDLAARRIHVFQKAAVMSWDMDAGLVVQQFNLPGELSGRPTKLNPDGAWLYHNLETGTLYQFNPSSQMGKYLLEGRFIAELSHDGTLALQQENTETESTFTVLRVDTGEELNSLVLPVIGLPQRSELGLIIHRGAVLSHDGLYLGVLKLVNNSTLSIYQFDTDALFDEVNTVAELLVGWGPKGLLMQDMGYSRGPILSGLYRYSIENPGVIQSYNVPGDLYRTHSVSDDGTLVYGSGVDTAMVFSWIVVGKARISAIELDTAEVELHVSAITDYPVKILPASMADNFALLGPGSLSTWSNAGALTGFRWDPSDSYRGLPSISPDGGLLCWCRGYQCSGFEVFDVSRGTPLSFYGYSSSNGETYDEYVSSSFSPDGRLLLVRSRFEHILIRVPEGEVVERFSSPEPLGFTGFDERDVLFRLGEKGQQSLLVAAPIYDRAAVRFSIPEPDFVDEPVVSSDGLRLYGIDVGTGDISEVSVTDGISRTIALDGGEVASHITVSPDNKLLAAATPTEIQVVRLDNLAVQQRIGAKIHTSAAFTQDSRWLLVEDVSVSQWPISRDTCLDACGGEDLDSDGDGLSDCYERCANTRPWNADTDGDGMSDGDEVANGTDPTVSDQVIEGYEEGEGMAEGGPEGISEGSDEGLAEGSLEGISEGEPEGSPDGAVEGDSEGAIEGEGNLEGLPEGAFDGEGSFEGGGEGMPEGFLDGEAETEGVLEGAIEGTAEGESREEGEPEGDVGPTPPYGCQCRGADGEPVTIWEFLGDLLVLGAVVLILRRGRYPAKG